MAQHSHHGDGHGHHGHDGHGHKHQGKRPVHKDWRLWFAVVLMLVAMAVYVLSDDESVTPGGLEQAKEAVAE
jgi:ABC-type Zn2+ transport system substrate-binding protein/surface adhesin